MILYPGLLINPGIIGALLSGASNVWKLASTWDHAVAGDSAEIDFAGLSGASDIFIVMRNVTKSVSGRPLLIVSTDNGATYRNTSGDYMNIADAGTEAAATTGGIFHETAATAARSGAILIQAANVPGVVKPIFRLNDATPDTRYFVQSGDPINAIRIFPESGGNFTGGVVYCFKK